jgi:hypothetical protein
LGEFGVNAFRLLVLVAFLGVSARAEAFPALQLDILGGHYDPFTQTIVSDGPDFTLLALLTPNPLKNNLAELLNTTYYIAAATWPAVEPGGSSLGSFTWEGTNYLITEDMMYGTPPLELAGADGDVGDLGPHGIYPTHFAEFAFQFSPENRAVTYNSALDTGGLVPTSATTGVSYFAAFNITTSLQGSNVLHFDLYNSYVQSCSKAGTCALDEDVAMFAPFSHDAESENRVPEAQSLLLMSTGLLIAGRLFRRPGNENQK